MATSDSDRPPATEPPPGRWCWSCDYPLAGDAPAGRCPECGRAFDAAAPRAVNTRGPIGRIGRWAVRGGGWITTALLIVGAAGVCWGTGWPGGPSDWVGRMLDWPMLRSPDVIAER